MKKAALVLVCIAVGLVGMWLIAKLPHVLYGKRVAGQVVDAETGKPIAGAHVALLWEAGIIPSGFTGHNSRDICYHAAAAVTDAQGRFDIPSWRKWSTYSVDPADPTLFINKTMYEPSQISLAQDAPGPPIAHLTEIHKLKPFSGSASERMKMLLYGHVRQCSYGGETQKSLYPMLKDFYIQARSIAKSQDELNVVQLLAELAADSALAPNPNGAADDAKTKAFIERYLK